MTCRRTVEFLVARGYDYRRATARCGLTDPWGGRAICGACRRSRRAMESHRTAERVIEADNANSRAAGYGDW